MSSIKPTTVPSKTLSESITAAATSFSLSDIAGWDSNDLTSADFGTKAYGVFRNSTNTLIELFEFDPSTIASSSITINYRGLKFDGTLDTEVTANKLAWTKGDTFVDLGTDVPQLLQHSVRTIGSPTIDELLSYTTDLTPTNDKHIATKKYVDDTTNGGAVSHDQEVVAATAGTTVVAGEIVYFDVTAKEWLLADASTAATCEGVILGIAQGAGTNGNPISGGVLISGLDTNQTGMTAGTKQYLSDTAGAISESTGTVEVSLGTSNSGSTTDLLFAPYYDQRITEDIQDALAGGGDIGTPSVTNKYITESFAGTRYSIDVYTADDTWTKQTDARSVEVYLIGAGGGGAGGNGVTAGSGGGGGGGLSSHTFNSSDLGATVSVTVGTGGVGGAPAVDGTVGGDTSFGTHLVAKGGGKGDSDDAYPGGSGGYGNIATGSDGGAGSASGAGTAGTAVTTFAGTGGGGGGAAAENGAAGGARTTLATLAGGTAGVTGSPGVAGGAGNAAAETNTAIAGTGGGGGGGGEVSGQDGGNGGAGGGYGSGGGGGGEAHTTGTAGTGGAGGGGVVVVISHM